jgi:hypothetical protein
MAAYVLEEVFTCLYRRPPSTTRLAAKVVSISEVEMIQAVREESE